MKTASAEYQNKKHGAGTFVTAQEDVRNTATALWTSGHEQAQLPDPAEVASRIEQIGKCLSALYGRSENTDNLELLQLERQRVLDAWSKLTGLDKDVQNDPPTDAVVHGLWRQYCLALATYRGLISKTLCELVPYPMLSNGDRISMRTFTLTNRVIPAELPTTTEPAFVESDSVTQAPSSVQLSGLGNFVVSAVQSLTGGSSHMDLGGGDGKRRRKK